ncbi:SRPBCC family protein [Myxococcus sp. K15C18031901]|uniref:SRPBCC family protein n=1 Tax=Myxococcus dinghuensis TaxID=2906761 RepID=UPI0020A7849A|nr:SRPBCC family protein [Myxococcus dinghuensis]MCP3100819.1 SRPBCC family protein [Myxococcus dinghuensis]
MKAAWWSLGGVGVGVGLMYWADPRSGRWRRSHLQGRAVHVTHEAGSALGVIKRDVTQRSRGLFLESVARFRSESVDDVTVAERVRAALGRVCSHPGSVRVSVRNGVATLEGSILMDELRRVVPRVSHVRGVRALDNRLIPYAQPGRQPELQGGIERRPARRLFGARRWSPSARLVGLLGGLSLASWSLRRRGLLGTLVGAGGLVLGVRALSNLELRRLTGFGVGPRAITLHKDITVNAPVEEVFAFWDAMQNFPRFMTHVDEVSVDREGRSRWKVKGPAGLHFEWEAVVTQRVPNKLLAWRSEKGTSVENAGVIHFEPTPRGGTRVDIRLAYNPPAGAIGHAFARLLGVDPKRQMDDDLLRFKSLLERGKATGRETVTREELSPARSGPRQRMH